MNQYISFLKLKFLRIAVLLVAALATVSSASAFADSKYAPNSVLSSGRWVKVAVSESGLYALTKAQLNQWGFNEPEKVRVCGYGGNRIPDLMSEANFIDDLPVVPTFVTSAGNVVFYAVGPEEWNTSISSKFSRTSNIYTEYGYYFVTQNNGDEALATPELATSGRPDAINPETTFWDRLHYEKDLESPGMAGGQLVGEDFKLTPQREFKFNLTDRADDTNDGLWFETSFVAKTYLQNSSLKFTFNGVAIPETSTDRISATSNDSHYYGTEGLTRHTVYDVEGSTLTIKIAHSSSVTVLNAWLNYISVNYLRQLRLDNNGQLLFWSNKGALSLGNATASTRVFDVTNPQNISEVNISEVTGDGRRQWTGSYTGWRTYVAFNDNANLPEPKYVGTVANQDLHGQFASSEVPDMVILCTAPFVGQARRIAALHAEDTVNPLTVQIIEIDKVYNEFSSGAPDVSGIRKFFKMLWDKGLTSAPEDYESKFRYAILLGRTTYDFRLLTEKVRSFTTLQIPTWMTGNMRQSLNDTDGYGTDDFMTFLRDDSGTDKGMDDLCIALGRIPVRTVSEASNYIDKLEQYMTASRKTNWKNSIMMLADDADLGKHLEQSELFVDNQKKIPDNPFLINKVYMDSYVRQGNTYPAARDAMFHLLNEGVVWWTFIGHANDHSLTHNDQLTYTDLNRMYYKNIPVFYAATCDFLRWDQNSLSGGEVMLNERYGGAISLISATRPVYIYENGLLTAAFGRFVGSRDSNGVMYPVGEIYRRAKNNILTNGVKLSNVNRLKYVLMGDPAMRLATPSNIIDITEIDGRELSADSDSPIELHALQSAIVKGLVRDHHGNELTDFNGTVTVTLYDAEYSSTTYGNSDNNTEGKVMTFEQQGSRLTSTAAQVVNGRFELKISVPVDISDNYRPAAIGAYSYSADGKTEASGLYNNLYVYGFDESADVDDSAPVIESMYLNHSSFVDGGVTDSSPMLIATVTDDVAINLSTAGIGHSMFIQLDGNINHNDVAQYYTPDATGRPGGTINYPFSDLAPGEHELMLRVWDTSANSATKTITFTVGERIAPKIYDIYTDASPAYDKANFYLVHDRPDQMATVTVEVFNMLGRPLWSKTVKGVSDMFTSSPVTWDLTDNGGRRVQRGIYLYRATITVDGESYDTGSRRIAVAGQ